MRPDRTRPPPPPCCKNRAPDGARPRTRSRLARPLGVLCGLGTLAWLALRTGTKPSRLDYPCQRAALATSAGFLTGLVGFLATAVVQGRAAVRRRLGPGADLRLEGSRRNKATPFGRASLAAIAVSGLALAFFSATRDDESISPSVLPPPLGYAPDVYLVNHARGVEPGRFGGADDLITLMGTRGFKWHRSAAVTVTSGPSGLIAADSVVLLKINAQWSQRGGTNTDLIRGVVRRIVEHPDGFQGEVIVADNGQGSGSLSRVENNAEDRSQSVVRVVNDFAIEGWSVFSLLWDSLRQTAVEEFENGDSRNGYVVATAVDPETQIRLSYPKFTTPKGTCVSVKHGVWAAESGAYEPGRLVVINLPVLKTHAYYAVTAAVKNHMGVVTRDLGTDSHYAIGRGGLGSFLADVRMPDLTILDCIWILARPRQGPDASYTSASRRDQLVAGTDPVSLDAWAVKHILMPQIIANGYAASDYSGRQDPDNPASVFRQYLDLSMNELIRAGLNTTNDYRSVRRHTWTGDADHDGDVDSADVAMLDSCMNGPVGGYGAGCLGLDGDDDGDVDLADGASLQVTFSGPR